MVYVLVLTTTFANLFILHGIKYQNRLKESFFRAQPP